MSPEPDFTRKQSRLPQNATVEVIDAANVSKSRQRQIDESSGNQSKDAPAELEDTPDQPLTNAKAEYKYTVRDSEGRTAFLVSETAYNIGAKSVSNEGTEIWRSVSSPKHGDMQCISSGRAPTRAAAAAKSQTEQQNVISTDRV